jgi:hypothetical protein
MSLPVQHALKANNLCEELYQINSFLNDEKFQKLYEHLLKCPVTKYDSVGEDDNYKFSSKIDPSTGENVILPTSNISFTFPEITEGILKYDFLHKVSELISILYNKTVWQEEGVGVTVYSPGDGLPTHYDGMNRYLQTPSGHPTRDYSSVYYYNDDFEGGILHFTKLNIKIKPQPNMLLIFPSDELYTHRVEKVTSGLRYMSSNFWSIKE